MPSPSSLGRTSRIQDEKRRPMNRHLRTIAFGRRRRAGPAVDWRPRIHPVGRQFAKDRPLVGAVFGSTQWLLMAGG